MALRLGGIKWKKSIVNPSTLMWFPLFYSHKPQSQVWILTYKKWPIVLQVPFEPCSPFPFTIQKYRYQKDWCVSCYVKYSSYIKPYFHSHWITCKNKFKHLLGYPLLDKGLPEIKEGLLPGHLLPISTLVFFL